MKSKVGRFVMMIAFDPRFYLLGVEGLAPHILRRIRQQSKTSSTASPKVPS
jgi:hypothetical protein